MEFKIQKKEKNQEKHYSSEELDIAREFTKQAHKEFGNFLKAVVLFGSHAKKNRKTGDGADTKSDIDILVVIDDVSMVISKEITETYQIIMERMFAKMSNKLHLTTLRFTNFWELAKNGDPVAINILRDGIAIIDTGIFDPLQILLYEGRIRPTWESIWTYYTRSPATMQNSRWHVLQATLDLYWAVIDSAHAALMRVGEIPPSPSHIADLMERSLYKRGYIQKRYVTIMRNFHDIAKKIARKEITDVSGKEYDHHHKDAKDFLEVMKRIIEGGQG